MEATIAALQHLLSPAPSDLRVASVQITPQAVVVTLETITAAARCPTCGQNSERVHRRYWRHLVDLPIRRLPVKLRVHVRRFKCRTKSCAQQIFAERLTHVAAVAARCTQRLRTTLRDIALVAGGEAGARLAYRLGLPTSATSLLRLVRQPALGERPAARVIGVDKWAKQKGRTYGTILVDLERHHVIDVLEDATAEAFRNWLRAHPGVEVISRDRAGVFAEGGRAGAPEALQVADRFHLLKNLTDAVEAFLRRIERHLPAKPVPTTSAASGSTPLASVAAAPRPSSTLTRLAQEQQRRRARRLARYEAVLDLQRCGLSTRQIALALGLDRQTVGKYLRAGTFPERVAAPQRPSLLDPFRAYLEQRFQDGCRNARQLFREVRDRGFRGQVSIVADAVAELRRRDPRPDAAVVQALVGAAVGRRESPRQVRWWLVGRVQELSEEECRRLDRVLACHEEVPLVSELAQEFGRIVRQRRADELAAWLECARRGPRELKSFAHGLERDRTAVEAGLREVWSQGQTEGQVNRLKLLKRASYGRAKVDLLRRRLIEAG